MSAEDIKTIEQAIAKLQADLEKAKAPKVPDYRAGRESMKLSEIMEKYGFSLGMIDEVKALESKSSFTIDVPAVRGTLIEPAAPQYTDAQIRNWMIKKATLGHKTGEYEGRSFKCRCGTLLPDAMGSWTTHQQVVLEQAKSGPLETPPPPKPPPPTPLVVVPHIPTPEEEEEAMKFGLANAVQVNRDKAITEQNRRRALGQ